MTFVYALFTRICRAMFSRPLPESALRALTHEQLLAYTLKHAVHPPAHGVSAVPRTAKKARQHRAFDMSRYGQRLVALRLAYTGWRFHGFASQVDSDNTVEDHLFRALLKTRLIESRHTCAYSRSGRTDVGVSALGQVVGLRLRSEVVPPSRGRSELDYVKILNGNLPQGIRVLAWMPVAEGGGESVKTYASDPEVVREHWARIAREGEESEGVRRPGEAFSARFDAVARAYKYFFVRGELDVAAMREAASLFEGTHDFRNFCRIDENVTNFRRHMYTVEVRAMRVDGDGDGARGELEMYYIYVKGQAFLWHQVRCMAAVLFDVGLGREDATIVRRLLDDATSQCGRFSNGRPQYRMASPTPLVLFHCQYPESVLAFPQAVSTAGCPARGVVKGAMEGAAAQTSFERADASLALDFADAATKAAVLEAMLEDNDARFLSGKGGETFGSRRAHRQFLLGINKGKHIPYEERACDEPLEKKVERAARKRKAKELAA